MDIWFSLFVAVVAITAAVGFSLALVGYINVLPPAFGAGRGWVLAGAFIPSLIVGLPVAAIVIISPFKEVMAWETLARWLAIPAGILHVATLVRFLQLNWQDHAKTGKQLIAGFLLMGIALLLLYGLGPQFAERVVASVK